MELRQKHFRKRDAVLECLRGTDTHPSAEWVYAQLKRSYPDISLGTVYRNLAFFKEQGTIVSLGTVKGVERFDGNTAPHVHFICTECGRVLDLMQMKVPEELSEAASSYSGGHAESCQLSFTGLCGDCCKTVSETGE
ncbi:MAG: transcriptional repressor [Oscillospiraceae bacterium]|nr:transcriptional repressor [Oscillospiraceae bacterium]